MPDDKRAIDTPDSVIKEAGAPEYEPPYRWAGVVGLMVFALYAITLAPTTAFWDTSEYIATAHILGIPHPPGNPVFIILARTWEILMTPVPLPTAMKINLFSAAMSATAAAFWFLVVHRVLAFFSDQELFRRAGAGAAAFISATAFTVWNQSVVNEKVYTVSLMTIALLTWLIFRWRDNLGKGKDDNLLILIVFLLALSLGNHLMAFLVAPAMLLFIIWVHPRVLARPRLYAFAALAWFLGLSAQLALPIRANDRPVINEAEPVCGSVVAAAYEIVRLHPPVSLVAGKPENDRCPALASSLRREQYRKPPINLNPIFYVPGSPRNPPRDMKLLRWQFINFAQYFDWQWARSLNGDNTFFAWVRAPFTLVFLLLGLLGAWRHYYADRISWVYFAALFATVSFGLVIYLNFKYGYSVGATTIGPNGSEVGVPRSWREVRERDYFFIVSFSFWGVWAGIGLAALWRAFAETIAGSSARITTDHLKRASPVLLLALLPMLLNWQYASRAGDYAARDWAYNLLMSVEPYGVLFTNGDNDTFPLWYLQEVEGLRQDVTVIVYSYLATPWYSKQLRDLTAPCDGQDPSRDETRIICQRSFEPDEALPIYSEMEWTRPTRSILQATDEQLESVPECYPIDRRGNCAAFADTQAVRIGGIVGTIPRGERLLRNDIMLLQILQGAAGDRPIYFAGTTGTYENFDLQRWMVRQGVAFKLEPIDFQPRGSIIPIPVQARNQGGRDTPWWINVERTETLLEEHYIYRDITEWDFWPDLTTSGIPLQYYQAYMALANAELVTGDQAESDSAVDRAIDFLEVALGPLPEEMRDVRPETVAPPAATDVETEPIELPPDSEPGGRD
ncbi:MAG: DUF2723 domain-containing protein [Gemmatimonadetes bacterium]|uniref:DUF2723 domain-containing protein n=1 Tax=Candidatus Kutchimonas denitrificans TaxID=3056748 RepID=A0AAE4Z9J7_9BACT|nr:DUF2723 domain-containing protein [Gemmatimonadota bacterium]NIR76280.1 DUF2723 domain-containing protein [Candidatus Kutchimonas denitrificans]NIS02303.1 DUF2723 domain-containing protein [Gemmatimonadota bacterium]NIT68122.1 DUF2723 domain-containing protein [Gemmatimonadota bacterium]NIU54346.1 DUF2723 domain-containing protein [Gemmatimonadota bacterium]